MHRVAVTKPKELGEMLRRIVGNSGVIIKTALLFGALAFLRSGDIRNARRVSIEFDRKQWMLTSQKNKRPLIVPRYKQLIQQL